MIKLMGLGTLLAPARLGAWPLLELQPPTCACGGFEDGPGAVSMGALFGAWPVSERRG